MRVGRTEPYDFIKLDLLGPPRDSRVIQHHPDDFGRPLKNPYIDRRYVPEFKKGGLVKKTGVAFVHKGEFVLPVGVKPTKAQIKQVAKRKNRK
jgi:hypothetical protein